MKTLAATPSRPWRIMPDALAAPGWPGWDPRLYQIATLGGLLAYGVLWLRLDVEPTTAAVILATALAAQLAAARATGGRLTGRGAASA